MLSVQQVASVLNTELLTDPVLFQVAREKSRFSAELRWGGTLNGLEKDLRGVAGGYLDSCLFNEHKHCD